METPPKGGAFLIDQQLFVPVPKGVELPFLLRGSR
jgi:hypothetical protein